MTARRLLQVGLCTAWCLVCGTASFAQNALQPETQLIAGRACGPIAAYVAVVSQGHPTSLPDLVLRSGWTLQGGTTLQGVIDAVRSVPGMKCDPVQLAPGELSTVLRQEKCVAILPVSVFGDSTPTHVIVALSDETNPDHLHVIDYPEELRDVGDLSDVYQWKGAALLVKSTSTRRASAARYGAAGGIAGLLATAVSLQFVRSRPRCAATPQ